MLLDAGPVVDSFGVEPGACREAHDPGANVVRDSSTRKTAPTVVEYTHDVAVADTPAPGIDAGQADGLAAQDLVRLTVRAGVELTVQPPGRLVGKEMQRKVPGPIRTQPFSRREPLGMAEGLMDRVATRSVASS